MTKLEQTPQQAIWCDKIRQKSVSKLQSSKINRQLNLNSPVIVNELYSANFSSHYK